MLRVIWRSLRAGVVTTGYPAEPDQPPPGFRGAPVLRAGGRFADLPPPESCPAGALTRSGDGTPGATWALDLGRCLFCGRCESGGADAPITTGRAFELAARRRADLVVEAGCDEHGRIAGLDPAAAAESVSQRIRRTLGRSLHLRHLDAGSCNGCDWELTALLNPIYDVRRLGIDFVASPRHADGVIVTGPVTRNLEVAVRRTYDAVPDPRIVIAVGACATSGGIVGKSYASCGGVAEVLPVDVFIPGCPPRPQAIIHGILLAVGRLAARR
jgi:Ni,Fe-hydrogenase III small subunit